MKVRSSQKSETELKQGQTQAEVEAEICLRAYELYEVRGYSDERDLDDWLQAEAEILETKRKVA